MSSRQGHWRDSVAEVALLYGERGAQTFTQAYGGRTDLSPAEALRLFRMQPTQVSTRFFREPNLWVFAARVAGGLLQQLGVPELVIGDQASSNGMEARSLAAMLTAHKVPFRIHAFDVSPLAIDTARQNEYPGRLEEIASRLGRSGAEQYLHPYFEQSGGVVRAKPILEERITFGVHDLLEGPPPGPKRHVQIAENVLWHLPASTGSRDRMLGNIVGNLVAGGAFMFEGLNGNSRQGENYAQWVDGLAENHGLQPVAAAGERWAEQIRVYQPQG